MGKGRSPEVETHRIGRAVEVGDVEFDEVFEIRRRKAGGACKLLKIEGGPFEVVRIEIQTFDADQGILTIAVAATVLDDRGTGAESEGIGALRPRKDRGVDAGFAVDQIVAASPLQRVISIAANK